MSEKTIFKLGELFCGPGGLACGALRAKSEDGLFGIEHAWANDYDKIEDPEILEEFRIKLDNVGYSVDPEYDSFNFVFKGSEVYTVNDEFPRLRRREVNDAIGNVKYTIMIAGIADFRE